MRAHEDDRALDAEIQVLVVRQPVAADRIENDRRRAAPFGSASQTPGASRRSGERWRL
jgi:hypothetical protein